VVATTASKLEVQRLGSKSDKNVCNNSCITKFVEASVLSQKAHKSNGDKMSSSNLDSK
jgi:hypothetical protein